MLIGQRNITILCAAGAEELERRLRLLVEAPSAGPFSGGLAISGRVDAGAVRLQVRKLSLRQLRLDVAGTYLTTRDGAVLRLRARPDERTLLSAPVSIVGAAVLVWLGPAEAVLGLLCFGAFVLAVVEYNVHTLSKQLDEALRVALTAD